MMKRFAQALGASLAAMLISGAALAAEEGHPEIARQPWAF